MVFERIGIPAAGGIINFVVITAAASSCNSGIFSTGRMLYTLAQFGQAPRMFGKVNAGHVPAVGVTVSAAVMLIGVAAQLRGAGAGVRLGHQRSDGRGAVDLGHDPHRPHGLSQGCGRGPSRAELVPHAGRAYHELDRAGVHRAGHAASWLWTRTRAWRSMLLLCGSVFSHSGTGSPSLASWRWPEENGRPTVSQWQDGRRRHVYPHL